VLGRSDYDTAGIAQSVRRLGCGLDDWGSIPGWVNDGIFSLHHRVQTVSEANPGSSPMCRALSPEIKRLGSEDDHPLPSSAEVKNACSYTSTLPTVPLPFRFQFEHHWWPT
jgi:hypothetical protein